MKKLASTSLALFSLAAFAACSNDAPAPLSPTGTTSARMDASSSGRYIVSFNGNKSLADVQAAVAAQGGTLEWYHAGAGLATVSGLSGTAAAALPGAGDVQADDEVTLDPVAEAQVSDESADGVITGDIASQSNPATAFFYPRQWHHRAIGANLAWAAGKTGSPSVRVAILDTGIDYANVDLNGLVDLAHSASFVPGDAALVAANFPTRNVVTDLHYHGTHVASTVSSKALVVAGVTSRTTLMAVKVLGASGSGSTSGVLRGILFAADNDADVINMSLGSYFAKAGNGRFIGQVMRTINYANRMGTLIVVSAGNDHADLDHDGNAMALYCNTPNVVCVAATGPTAQAGTNGPWTNVDAHAGYSNFGRSAIDVAAPGGNASSVWQTCSQTSLAIPVCRTGNFTVGLSGTSMASPHVSGLAALVVAQIGHDRPSQVKARILQTADDLGETGTDPFYGKGRINVARAIGL